jgi:hypothetical protein
MNMKKNSVRAINNLPVIAAKTLFLLFALMAMIAFAGCSDDDEIKPEPKSAECELVSFTVNGEEWEINGTDISHTYPAGTVKMPLAPNITLSAGATVNPASGTAQNFFTEQGVTYTVTAEDGETKKTYTAKATVGASAACNIITFTVNGETWDISGTDITHTYPAGTNETTLIPTITLSAGATVYPASGMGQNFFTEHGVTYTVTAEDGNTKKTYIAKATVKEDEVPPSGTTGDCTWALTGTPGNYTLTISGTGAMGNYSIYSRSPWYSYRNDIKALVINAGVTAIGNSAFTDHAGLTGTLTIPNSVTYIGDEAFSGCSGFTGALTIPNSVATIGSMAFFNCSGFTGALVIPNSVVTIRDEAFEACVGFNEITVGKSVNTIGINAFSNCENVTDINVDADNAQYSSENGVLFNKDKRLLICCPMGKSGVYTVPGSVTNIGNNAFTACYRLTEITIGNSVNTIGDNVLYNCTGLIKVNIGNSLSAIGEGVFTACVKLTDIIVDAGNMQYASEDGVLFNKDKTTLINYPAGKTGSYTVPGSVTVIGNGAFAYCSGLTGTLAIPNLATIIGNQAFLNCTGLTGITIGNSVNTIGTNAFYSCTGLTSITLPSSVTTIGNYAFFYCIGLTEFTNLNPTPQNIDMTVFLGVTLGPLTLKVPAGSVAAYQTATVWRIFGTIVGI